MPINDKVKDKIKLICKDFDDKYITKHKTLYNITKLSNKMIKDLYPEIIRLTVFKKDDKDINYLIKTLTEVYIKFNIPYDVLNKELAYLQRTLLYVLLESEDIPNALNVISIFEKMHIIVNKIFLDNYLKILLDNNELRLKTLHSNINDEMMFYYESHIKWVSSLALSILNRDVSLLPETNHEKCGFGKWLTTDNSKNIIHDKDDYRNLNLIHKKLHDISKIVSNLLKAKEIHTHEYLTYIYKAENISKDIGIKLSNISNQISMNKATKDPLTGVLNRELLEKLFTKEYELHATTETNMLFVICDLDHFKKVNDNYGHVAGDKVLKVFATLLQEQLRSTDIIIRYGGEEFILILPSVNLFQGAQILDQVRKKLKNKIIVYEEKEIQITVSMGVIELNPDIKETEIDINNKLEECIKQSDVLLYKAKNNGRNRIEV